MSPTDMNSDAAGGLAGESPSITAPTQPQVVESPESVITRLAAMKPLEYDQARKACAQRLGIQLKTLDQQVKARRAESGSSKAMPFAVHEPWNAPVDLAELLSAISAVIKVYIVLEPEQADAAALWVAHTYLTPVADVSPIAIINAPERACAKTLFQTVLGQLVHRPLFASNASLSALFRSIDSWGPTLLIDEADTFFRDNADLHGMVNAGYKRGGTVLRSEVSGDSFEPKAFPVYCAKSIAGIALEKHLPDSTMSRGIVFNMRRKLVHEKVERYRHADQGQFDRLASQLVRFAEDYQGQVQRARPFLPEALSDRAQDNWEPLLAIASCASPDWLERATVAALKMSIASEVQASTGNDLLADIREVLAKWEKPTIKSADLIDQLIQDEDLGWSTYNRGKPFTPRQLAKLLGVYGIKPRTVRQPKTALEPNGSTPKGYEVADFKDAFDRYLKVSADDPADKAVPPESVLESPSHDAATAQRGSIANDSCSGTAADPEAPDSSY
jgi:putative DNA primase/helicase